MRNYSGFNAAEVYYAENLKKHDDNYWRARFASA